MPSKIGTAFFGLIVGGVTFLITGFAVFLTIGQIEQRTIAARSPILQQQEEQFAQFAPRPLRPAPARN